ncbi:25548_t:CDS:2, partial [Dentiscutata erythropus]
WEIPDNAEKGYILEVDLDYPYKLYKAHTSYPLAPENIKISKEEMTLQFYIKQGMVLTKIYRAIEFNQSPWMKPFMEELARSYFVRPEGESKKFKKLVADPNYKLHRILAENLVGISRHQSKARLSKPIFIGISVLDENNVEVVYTDTDSLILLIQTENVYKDMAEMYEYFDFSDYKPEHPIYKALGKEKIILNKKVPGKFKDESCGTAMWKFCRPRPKLYSYNLANGKTDRRAKGIQKVVKKNLTHDMYEDCLKSQKECIVTMHKLGSKNHIIRLLHSSKV